MQLVQQPLARLLPWDGPIAIRIPALWLRPHRGAGVQYNLLEVCTTSVTVAAATYSIGRTRFNEHGSSRTGGLT